MLRKLVLFCFCSKLLLTGECRSSRRIERSRWTNIICCCWCKLLCFIQQRNQQGYIHALSCPPANSFMCRYFVVFVENPLLKELLVAHFVQRNSIWHVSTWQIKTCWNTPSGLVQTLVHRMGKNQYSQRNILHSKRGINNNQNVVCTKLLITLAFLLSFL